MRKAWIGVLASLALPLAGCQAFATWQPAPYGARVYLMLFGKTFDLDSLYGSADYKKATKLKVNGSLKFLDGDQPLNVWVPNPNIYPESEWQKEAVDVTDGNYTVTMPRWGIAFMGVNSNDD